jgi:integrase
VNNELQAICKELGLPKVSMYWARHSWATLGAELDIPKETIGAALGHSNKTVTDIYINFDRNKIDRANRQVLDFVLYNKKQQDMFDLIRQLNDKVDIMTKYGG